MTFAGKGQKEEIAYKYPAYTYILRADKLFLQPQKKAKKCGEPLDLWAQSSAGGRGWLGPRAGVVFVWLCGGGRHTEREIEENEENVHIQLTVQYLYFRRRS